MKKATSSTNKQSEEKQERRAVILAGGDGLRLLTLTRRISGRNVPKQFCPLFGKMTLLEETHRRVSIGFPARAITTVLTHGQERFYEPLLPDALPGNALVQPANRGTAPAILYALMRVAETQPGATVVVFPSDHYVSDDEAFMRYVELAIKIAEEYPRTTVLLGATPVAPDVGYGWIEAGDPLTPAGLAVPVYKVRQFLEKPSLDQACRMLKFEHVWWNTFVMAARLPTLLELIMRALPSVYIRFMEATSKLKTRLEDQVVNQLYDGLASIDFASAALARHPMELAVVPLRNVEWSDLGEPNRVNALLEREAIRPKLAI